MTDEYNPWLEANREISKENERLRKENSELWYFKERFERQVETIRELERQLHEKRTTIRIVQREGDILWSLPITKLVDSSEGLFIEVLGIKQEDNQSYHPDSAPSADGPELEGKELSGK